MMRLTKHAVALLRHDRLDTEPRKALLKETEFHRVARAEQRDLFKLRRADRLARWGR